MYRFNFLVSIFITAFCIGCNSRQVNTTNVEEYKEQIALADSILFYFQQEQFDKIVSHFDDNMKRQMNKEQLAVVWAQLNAIGKYAQGEFYGVGKINDVGDKVTYICYFGTQKLYFQLVLEKDNQVIGLFFKPQPN